MLKFSEIEDLLIHILSGQTESREMQCFMDQLLTSTLFFQRLYKILATSTQNAVLKNAAELNQIQMKSDTEMLEEIICETRKHAIQIHPLKLKIENLRHPLDRLKKRFSLIWISPKEALPVALTGEG